MTERIAVGGEILSKADVDQIVGAGITHVIDMRAEFDDDTLNDNRITILWLPQVDDGTMRPPGQYRKGIQFALPALSLANTKVFLHCSAGLNRRPTMCYALLRAFGFSQTEAISRIRAARPEVVFSGTQRPNAANGQRLAAADPTKTPTGSPTGTIFNGSQTNFLPISRGSGSPWWVSDNKTGLSTLYNGLRAKQSLIVPIIRVNGAEAY